MTRDENGRFVKGTSGGPGRPAKAREERYYEIAMTTVTYADWTAIIKKAVDQAKRGNPVARKWLSEYLAPQPQKHEHTGQGGDVITVEIIRQNEG